MGDEFSSPKKKSHDTMEGLWWSVGIFGDNSKCNGSLKLRPTRNCAAKLSPHSPRTQRLRLDVTNDSTRMTAAQQHSKTRVLRTLKGYNIGKP